jgi:ankyrin repeat protein
MNRRALLAGMVALTCSLAVSANAAQQTASRAKAVASHDVYLSLKDVNQADAYGNTPLLQAVEANDAVAVEKLIRAKANVNVTNHYHVAPLSIAALRGNVAVVSALLKAGADPNVLQGEGEPVLLTAARTGNVDVVKALLTAGADINVRERFYGQTAMMWAAIENHADVITELAARGGDVNARANLLEGEPAWRYGKDSRNGINGEALQNFNTNFSRGGLTPLLYAARQGATEAVRALIEHGASPATTDPEGFPPLQIAIANAHYDTAAALVDRGANVNQADRSGQTPLFALADIRSLLWVYNRPTPKSENAIDSLALASKLIAAGAKVDAPLTAGARRPLGGGGSALTGRGATTFLRAAVVSDLPLMRLLLEKGADPKVRTANGDTALHAVAGVRWSDTTMSTAVSAGFGAEDDSIEAARMLIGLGLDVNAPNNQGVTPMHGAAERGANKLIRFLVEQGGKLDTMSKPSVRETNVDNEPPLNIPGQTPLDAALDADPPRVATAKLIQELMGKDPSEPLRAPSKKR